MDRNRQRGFAQILVVVLLLVGLASLGAYYFGVQKGKTALLLPSSSSAPSLSRISTPSATPDPTANWKTYRIAQLGMEFRLPPKLSSLGELQDRSQATAPAPFTGKMFCLTISKNNTQLINGGMPCEGSTLTLGTVSVDYNVGRGGTFLDLGNFSYKNGKYYLRNGSDPLPDADATKVDNSNGVDILRLKSHFVLPSTGEQLPPPYYFGDSTVVGALVNTRDATFPGFAVKMNLVNGLTDKDFDQILSTFKFTQ